jgi:uncharacterized protein
LPARLRAHAARLVSFLCLFLWISGVVRAEKPDQLPKPTGYVSDFAGVLDDSSKERMELVSLEVYQKTQATIEIVTIKSLDGDTIEDFTTQLEDKWHVGAKDTNKGILMVFAIGDHKRRIEVGYGLEGILNDAKTGDIGRSMVPDLKKGDYGAAILMGQQQIADVIAADAGVTLEGEARHTYHREPVHHHWGMWLHLIWIVFILLVIFGRRSGGGGGGGGGGWGRWLPWMLLGSALNSRRDYGGGGYSGGGGSFGGFDGGGSSGGSSGGSDDFGGGFGGDSGGGGSSGDW